MNEYVCYLFYLRLHRVLFFKNGLQFKRKCFALFFRLILNLFVSFNIITFFSQLFKTLLLLLLNLHSRKSFVFYNKA